MEHSHLIHLTAQIAVSYLANNTVPASSIPDILKTIHGKFVELEKSGVGGPPPVPAVPVADSIQPDFIVCLNDGKKLKMLKRHIMHAYGLTPAAYREMWKLPADYPMTAPSYAKRRSKIAKQFGLGTAKTRRAKRR
jgi:predicted transcriptional regulator